MTGPTVAALDRWFPPRGPCGMCGHEDARHRLWDAILGRLDAGEPAPDVAQDYDVPLIAVQQVGVIRPYADPAVP